MFQPVPGGIGGAQHFDVEALEQGARPEFVTLQEIVYSVEMRISIRRRQLLLEPEHFLEHMIQPAA